MPLSQSDRIAISEKVVDIPKQDATADIVIVELGKAKIDATNKDNANKSLMDDITILIDPYQKEFNTYDGNERTELEEQDITDSAKKILQNPFSPNDTSTVTPSLSDGIWKNFPPFALNKAIGKKYDESYDTVDKEQDKIDAINAAIISAEALIAGTRSSGKECVAGLPTFPDSYTSSTAASSALSALQIAVDDWKDFVNNTKPLIQDENTVDSDATRQSENNTAIDDIDNLISVVDTWDALQDFDTGTALPSGVGGAGCALFAALTYTAFQPSKLREPELQLIKDEITARESFITTRKSQLDNNLGDIDQDLSDGSIISQSGFYGRRYSVINLRLHLMNGTANTLQATDRGIESQEEVKSNNNDALNFYASVMSVSKFIAPAAGTNVIHVEDGSLFSVSDNVYIKATKQEEISAVIESISSNRIHLNTNIPKKYRENEKARIYKIL